MTPPARTTRRAAGVRWVLGVVAAGVLAFSPVVAAAEGLADDPGPTDWPVVAEPEDANNSQSDPKPLDPPTVAQPEQGQGNDPKPVDWPAPAEQ